MKKKLTNEIKVFQDVSLDSLYAQQHRFHTFQEFLQRKEVVYPFQKEMLILLKETNPLPQRYYYIERGSSFAFFILYQKRMNIFTFGKMKCYINLNVVGFPCSLSEPGFVTNDEAFFLEYVQNMKGALLVLNVKQPILTNDVAIGETLPTCMLELSFESMTDYMKSMRSSYRRRIQLAIKKCKDIKVTEVYNDEEIYNEEEVYPLYLNTFNKSEYQLEKLNHDFFKCVNATKLVFQKDEKPVGFVLLKKINDRLVFMFCGMDYSYETKDLYYYMLYTIVSYGIDHQCVSIDFGQTSEETKMKFGANLQKRYFYAHHSIPLLNWALKLGKGFLEYRYHFPIYHVFKEVNYNESIIDKA